MQAIRTLFSVSSSPQTEDMLMQRHVYQLIFLNQETFHFVTKLGDDLVCCSGRDCEMVTRNWSRNDFLSIILCRTLDRNEFNPLAQHISFLHVPSNHPKYKMVIKRACEAAAPSAESLESLL